jgi:hypothetical protein
MDGSFLSGTGTTRTLFYVPSSCLVVELLTAHTLPLPILVAFHPTSHLLQNADCAPQARPFTQSSLEFVKACLSCQVEDDKAVCLSSNHL